MLKCHQIWTQEIGLHQASTRQNAEAPINRDYRYPPTPGGQKDQKSEVGFQMSEDRRQTTEGMGLENQKSEVQGQTHEAYLFIIT